MLSKRFVSAMVTSGLALFSQVGVAAAAKNFGLEIKPVQTLVFNAIPSSQGGEGGVEIRMTENLNFFMDFGYLSMTVGDEKKAETIQDLKEDENYYLSKIRTSGVTPGITYYSNKMAGWYGGVGMNFGQADMTTGHKDLSHELRVKQTTASPVLMGGYKWMWDSGFFMRLGLRIHNNKVVKEEITSSRENEEGQADIDRLKLDENNPTDSKSSAGVDFGLGMAF